MGKKIIFQKCSFNNIYFLLYIIMDFINLLIEYHLYPNKNDINEPVFKYQLSFQVLNFIYIYNLSDFFAIIPYLIRKRLLKKKKMNIHIKSEGNNSNLEDPSLIYTDKNVLFFKKKKKAIILNLIFISILDFLQTFSKVLFSIIYPDKEITIYAFSCTVPFEITLQFVCSYFILKIHFYKLQYFSLLLNLGIFIIILIIDLINILKFDSFNGKMLYFYAFNIIFYSIEYSFVKKILLYGFISIYFLMLIKGCIVFFLVLLFSLIMFLVNKDNFSRIIFFLTHKKYIWLTIAKIFTNFFLSLFLWLIIDRFSPNYLPFSLLSREVIYIIIDKEVN